MKTSAGQAPQGVEGLEHSAFFATPVMEATLSGADQLCAALREVITAKRAADPGIGRSNIGGWHSDTEMTRWGGPAAQDLGRRTLELCLSHTSDSGTERGRPRYQMMMEMWANVSPPGASNQLHAHPGSFWSAVFYVDDGGAPEENQLILQDPRFPTPQMAAPSLVYVDGNRQPMVSQVAITPAAGKLVCFPSWLLHSVRPNKGGHDRISIAMNILAVAGAPPQQQARW